VVLCFSEWQSGEQHAESLTHLKRQGRNPETAKRVGDWSLYGGGDDLFGLEVDEQLQLSEGTGPLQLEDDVPATLRPKNGATGAAVLDLDLHLQRSCVQIAEALGRGSSLIMLCEAHQLQRPNCLWGWELTLAVTVAMR